MASVTAAIRQIRRARNRLEASPPKNFDRYRPEYETVFEATAALGGDEAFDDLREWALQTTRDRGRLPSPAELRERARKICEKRGITVPQDSPLRG